MEKRFLFEAIDTWPWPYHSLFPSALDSFERKMVLGKFNHKTAHTLCRCSPTSEPPRRKGSQ